MRFDEQLLNRLQAAPGVEVVSVANSLPVRGQTDITLMNLGPGKNEQAVGVHSVSPGYFRIFRIPLRCGRWLTARDRAGAQKVLLVNETAAGKFWPGENPIGKHVLLKVWDTGEQEAEVVGVAGDVRYDGVEKPAENDVYVGFAQYPEAGNVVLRVVGDPMSAAAFVRTAVHELDKDLPVYGIQTMEQHLARATSRTRFSAVLLGVLAVLALRARGSRRLWRGGVLSGRADA